MLGREGAAAKQVDRAEVVVRIEDVTKRFGDVVAVDRVSLDVRAGEFSSLQPLGALDVQFRNSMQLRLKRIQREVGIAFLCSTHDQEEAMTMSDRIAVMRHGRVEQVGPPEEADERPATEFVASFLGGANLLPGVGPGDPVRLAWSPEHTFLVEPSEAVEEEA
jgi:ABC-type Fe3+/spermidine/putrescine transport system ATPase subunit